MIRKDLDFLNYVEKLTEIHPSYFLLEKYKPKDIILKQAKKYQSLYIIKSGITKCYLVDEKGKEFIQEFLSDGMDFGELEVFSGNLSYCTIEAISNIMVYKISFQHFNHLLENDPIFNRLVLKGMALKLTYKAPRHSFQQSHSVKDNILKLKKDYPNYDEIFSKNDIANYLGITIRSLNRALNDLNKE